MKKACSYVLTLILFLGVAMCLPSFSAASAKTLSSAEFSQKIDGIITAKNREYNTENILCSAEFLSHAGTTNADWLAFSLARYGYKGDYAYYLGALSEVIQKKYETPNKLSGNKPTEWHRLSLAVGATGASQIIGEAGGAKIDLYNDGIFYKDSKQFDRQGLPAYIWALITINALNLPEPSGALITKNDIINSIISRQKNGGFMLTGSEIDVDMTAMAITALANIPSKQAEDSVSLAVTTLSGAQNDDGTFSSGGKANAASTAWVAIAMQAAKVDISDVRFVKNGNNVVDALQKFALEGGGYCQNLGGEYDSFTTNQVLYAYIDLWRAQSGKPPLFDLTNSENNLLPAPILTQADKQAALDYKNKKITKDDYFILTRLQYLITMSPEYEGRADQLGIVRNALSSAVSGLPAPTGFDVKVLIIIIAVVAFVVIISATIPIVIKKKNNKKEDK